MSDKEDIVLGYERDDLISLYAEVLASGKVTAEALTYDPEIETERLLFEKQKWEAEMEEKKRWEAEMEEKKQRELVESEQLELRRCELRRQEMRDAAEVERSTVMKGKLFGDAMRASAIHMGADAIDAVPFFRNTEQLFAVYEVPAALQSVLIRPFLNDKSKSILGKLSPEVSGDYQRLKATLLQEFKLSANVYLERFNKCCKTSDETYVAFASKLKGLYICFVN